METNKANQELKSLDTSNFNGHSILNLNTKSERKNFLNNKVKSLINHGSKVDVIVVSESPDSFSSIIQKCLKNNAKSVSYAASQEEMIGAVDSVRSLIAFRSFMFDSASVKNWSDFNLKNNNECSAVEVCFDIAGNEMWSEDNFESFQALNDLVQISKDYGISMTFFNLTESAQKMSLEIAAQ